MPGTPEALEQLARELKKLTESLALERPDVLTSSRAKRVRKTIGEAYESLRKVMDELDPVRQPAFMFDPSDPGTVGRLVGITMVAQERKPLAEIERFYGSGVYAIYYKGGFSTYSALSGKEHPIYVGKVDPENPSAKTPVEQGDKLTGRLEEHRRNIEKATSTLSLNDFEYRALVVQSGWQSSAESYLIHLFKPIWNSEVKICYGFGKHGDSPKTRANLRSPWDTLHPGREWAHRDPNMGDARTANRIKKEITSHLEQNTIFESIDQILRIFLEEIRGRS